MRLRFTPACARPGCRRSEALLQEQLWEVFAEALRDFLKARSRPGIGGPSGAAALPERLAMRERDLASDLEALRQWKAIIETFYTGLSEEQRRGADQLLTQLFGF